jgi:hypothetical protein
MLHFGCLREAVTFFKLAASSFISPFYSNILDLLPLVAIQQPHACPQDLSKGTLKGALSEAPSLNKKKNNHKHLSNCKHLRFNLDKARSNMLSLQLTSLSPQTSPNLNAYPTLHQPSNTARPTPTHQQHPSSNQLTTHPLPHTTFLLYATPPTHLYLIQTSMHLVSMTPKYKFL